MTRPLQINTYAVVGNAEQDKGSIMIQCPTNAVKLF